MVIETFASGSAGNAYRISDGDTALLLECGLPLRQLQRYSGYTLAQAAACLLTHEHGDHAKAARDLLAFGVPVWCSQGTAEKLGISASPGLRLLRHLQPARCGTLHIRPFSVFHDAAEPLGWLIESAASGERLLFLTDTGKADLVFPPCEYILVECNHLGVDSMGSTNAFLAQRVAQNHLSLAACIRFLQAQDLGRTKYIQLLHISKAHGDPVAMRRAVAAATGKMIVA